MHHFTVLIFIFGSSSFAGEMCWQKEFDPQTNQVFESEVSYEETAKMWQEQKPKTPSLLAQGKAYAIYKSERDEALKLGSDKRAHCYVGCRIAQGTSFDTAIYVGWKKEVNDLKDCDLNTHFDPLDYTATKFGASAAKAIENSRAACAEFCVDNVELF